MPSPGLDLEGISTSVFAVSFFLPSTQSLAQNFGRHVAVINFIALRTYMATILPFCFVNRWASAWLTFYALQGKGRGGAVYKAFSVHFAEHGFHLFRLHGKEREKQRFASSFKRGNRQQYTTTCAFEGMADSRSS